LNTVEATVEPDVFLILTCRVPVPDVTLTFDDDKSIIARLASKLASDADFFVEPVTPTEQEVLLDDPPLHPAVTLTEVLAQPVKAKDEISDTDKSIIFFIILVRMSMHFISKNSFMSSIFLI
jgi:hypothetical protein